MRHPRSRQFDPTDPPWLHCISRCVRRAFLCGDGLEHRKVWLERRLRLLSRCCAVRVGAYAIMSNHLHVVLRPRPQDMASWSAEQIVHSWWYLREDIDPDELGPDGAVPPRPPAGLVERLAGDQHFVATWRARLGTVSWFMKALKEPLSRQANREDGCTGAFWEGRFTSVPLLDQTAIITCMAYVDLNPIRAQLASIPEESEHTSVKARIDHLRRPSQCSQPGSAPKGNAATATWLTPVPEMTSSQPGDPGWSLDSYLSLVEATGRMIRGDKRGAIPADLPGLLARLEDGSGHAVAPQRWLATMAQPRTLGGTALGAIACLAREARRRGMAWLQLRCPLFAPPAGSVS